MAGIDVLDKTVPESLIPQVSALEAELAEMRQEVSATRARMAAVRRYLDGVMDGLGEGADRTPMAAVINDVRRVLAPQPE